MATLQKLNPPKTNAYTVTIAYTDGIRGYTNIHSITDPTKDTALQVLVYTKDNGLVQPQTFANSRNSPTNC